MSVLAGFLATWSQARATFGEGAPQTGESLDGSARLRQLQSQTASAAPGSHWSGAAAAAYAGKNTAQVQTLGNLADLDERMATEVSRSAAVVTQGRRDLDSVRQWVLSAASTVPNTAAGDQMRLQVVSKGSGDIADIVTRCNGELSAIAERIRAIGDEYAMLGDPAPGTTPPS